MTFLTCPMRQILESYWPDFIWINIISSGYSKLIFWLSPQTCPTRRHLRSGLMAASSAKKGEREWKHSPFFFLPPTSNLSKVLHILPSSRSEINPPHQLYDCSYPKPLSSYGLKISYLRLITLKIATPTAIFLISLTLIIFFSILLFIF